VAVSDAPSVAAALLPEADRREIQGMITTGWGHLPRAGFVFLRLGEPQRGRDWLQTILPQVTTAAPWTKDESGAKLRPESVLNVAFSYAGLERLGLPEEGLATFPTEYAVGMPARAAILGDHGESAPSRWQFGGSETEPLHAALVVYATDEGTLDQRLEELRADIASHDLEEVRVERGARHDRSREHFGFANDGISQPGIEGVRSEDVPGPYVVRTGEMILGHLNERDVYPVSPAVAARHDPKGLLPEFPGGALPDCRDLGRNGSFLVYRKLEQDVAGFWRFLQAHCSAAGSGRTRLEHEMVELASKFMGRWPTGAPLVLSPDSDDPSLAEANDFMYRADDPTGLSCPIGAHIRRANPRDSQLHISDTPDESMRATNQHRIIRRGIPYGPFLYPEREIELGNAPVDLEGDGEERGLHFFALNVNTKLQFEFVQQTWIDNAQFCGLFDEKDPIVGDNDGTRGMTIQRLPVRDAVRGIPRFVHVRAGGYFFLPGGSALRYLAELG
jgi:Dyp-type peroxidase family